MSQGLYWLLTIPQHAYLPYLPPACRFIRGQLETGANTGYLHWQVLVSFKRKVRLAGVKAVFGDSCHAELSRSSAADEYVWKEDTAVAGTRFELGERAIKRNSNSDWDAIWESAKRGKFEEIPSDVRIRSYSPGVA